MSAPEVGLRRPQARRASSRGRSHLQSSHRGSRAQVRALPAHSCVDSWKRLGTHLQCWTQPMGSAISSHCVEKTGGTVHQTSLPDLPLLLPGRAVGSQYSVDLAKATPSSLRTADCCRTCCRHFQTLCPVLPRVVSLGASIADAIAALRSDAEKETLVIAGGGKYTSMNVPPPTFKPHKWCWTAKSKRVYALCVCFRVHGNALFLGPGMHHTLN